MTCWIMQFCSKRLKTGSTQELIDEAFEALKVSV